MKTKIALLILSLFLTVTSQTTVASQSAISFQNVRSAFTNVLGGVSKEIRRGVGSKGEPCTSSLVFEDDAAHIFGAVVKRKRARPSRRARDQDACGLRRPRSSTSRWSRGKRGSAASGSNIRAS